MLQNRTYFSNLSVTRWY